MEDEERSWKEPSYEAETLIPNKINSSSDKRIRYSEDQKNEIIEKYLAGSLFRDLGISHNTLSRWLLKRGLVKRSDMNGNPKKEFKTIHIKKTGGVIASFGVKYLKDLNLDLSREIKYRIITEQPNRLVLEIQIA